MGGKRGVRALHLLLEGTVTLYDGDSKVTTIHGDADFDRAPWFGQQEFVSNAIHVTTIRVDSLHAAILPVDMDNVEHRFGSLGEMLKAQNTDTSHVMEILEDAIDLVRKHSATCKGQSINSRMDADGVAAPKKRFSLSASVGLALKKEKAGSTRRIKKAKAALHRVKRKSSKEYERRRSSLGTGSFDSVSIGIRRSIESMTKMTTHTAAKEVMKGARLPVTGMKMMSGTRSHVEKIKRSIKNPKPRAP